MDNALLHNCITGNFSVNHIVGIFQGKDMDVEFEYIAPKIKVIEHAFRTVVDEDECEKYRHTYFQTRIDSEGLNENTSVSCTLSYYNHNGVFLGTDGDLTWCGAFNVKNKAPVPLSFEINIPEGATKVKCQLNQINLKKSFFQHSWDICIGLVVMILVSWLIKLWL